jgi:hypothetical protein
MFADALSAAHKEVEDERKQLANLPQDSSIVDGALAYLEMLDDEGAPELKQIQDTVGSLFVVQRTLSERSLNVHQAVVLFKDFNAEEGVYTLEHTNLHAQVCCCPPRARVPLADCRAPRGSSAQSWSESWRVSCATTRGNPSDFSRRSVSPSDARTNGCSLTPSP